MNDAWKEAIRYYWHYPNGFQFSLRLSIDEKGYLYYTVIETFRPDLKIGQPSFWLDTTSYPDPKEHLYPYTKGDLIYDMGPLEPELSPVIKKIRASYKRQEQVYGITI